MKAIFNIIKAVRRNGPPKPLIAVAVGLALGACGSSSDESAQVDAGPQVSPELRAEVVAALGRNVLWPETQAFEASATSLESTLAALVVAPADEAAWTAAREAWLDTMAALQRLELMQVGPHGFPTSVVGGLGIREEIYAWPIVSRCGVDENLVDGTYASASALATEPVNVRGMAVLEYLLFSSSTTNACGSLNAINTTGSWASLTDLPARRATYAAQVAALIRSEATRLREAWDESAGDFVGTIGGAGSAGNPYADSLDALNGISDAMFYLDLVTKDQKVAIPAGISLYCGAETCPASVESALSDSSLAHVRQNLIVFRHLFTGGDGSALGFDDLLISVEQEALAQQVVTAVDDAVAAVDAVEGPLETAVDAHPDQVATLHAAIKGVTDLLKGQFLQILSLDRPAAAAGDND